MIRTGFGRPLIALALAGVVGLIGLTAAPPTLGATGIVRLMAAGDVMLGRTIGDRILSKGVQWPFYRVASTLSAANLVLVNLECAITNRGTPWPNKAEHFRGPRPESADSLVAGGIDFVSDANNHALDYSALGLSDTIRALNNHAIGHAGAGANRAAARTPWLVSVNGLRLAILAYVRPMSESAYFSTLDWEATSTSPGVAIARASEVAADVAAAKSHADIVIVFFHYGKIGQSSPNKNQLALSHAALNAGASLVIGAHPHQLQGYAATAHTLVAYSLGNFVFDSFTGVSNDSVILDVTLTASGVSSFRWIPVVVYRGRPRLAVGDEVPRILARIPNLSG
jgi:poly-gamma-glutamate capsule biosynthesis protein CapA/YwtB (metallophosphatase superfamily)